MMTQQQFIADVTVCGFGDKLIRMPIDKIQRLTESDEQELCVWLPPEGRLRDCLLSKIAVKFGPYTDTKMLVYKHFNRYFVCHPSTISHFNTRYTGYDYYVIPTDDSLLGIEEII